MSVDITRRVVEQMRAQGNQKGLIRIFKEEMWSWSFKNSRSPDAAALQSWLPMVKERPFYTASELVPLFPALALMMGFTQRLQPQKSSARLSNELYFVDLPLLSNANGTRSFEHPYVHDAKSKPILMEFFIVERIHHWKKIALTQREFEKEFSE